eukprot:CAMPEP_0204212936 /NCGR_PEP_ID=MMETSP0361-20130328/75620_1 /ASSEMBLY_ACC=CAM_ASM_000343 /TAXON_ID=268821 /ORGANISM="Scrippsiella Hangoei, Strain SHTV-5" /LENGTH=40 /DNA_ID= /DNA_START= /DNA_END= /DNA_ORIENTATION=
MSAVTTSTGGGTNGLMGMYKTLGMVTRKSKRGRALQVNVS